VLKQPQYTPLPVAEQVAVLLATTEGLFDALEPEQVDEAEQRVRDAIREARPALCDKIHDGTALTDEDRAALLQTAREALAPMTDTAPDS
jgi:F-type H+-transporting ATPase subunit alpha